jgi:3-oxosteroid 1-dehydrogenase
MTPKTTWDEEAEVVVVGYGGAGAVTAITAHDAGAKVLLLEKQPSDTPERTNHTPSSRMSGGHWYCPVDLEKTILYLHGLVKVSNESLDVERKELISVFARYLTENTDWMKSIGAETIMDAGTGVGNEVRYVQDSPTVRGQFIGNKFFLADLPKLPGAESSAFDSPKPLGKYRNGAAFFKYLSEAVNSRKIPILWQTSGMHLVTQDDEVRGIVVKTADKLIRIKAGRAVVLTCGGFEFNERLKQNYLRAYPAFFTGNPGNTGDGITMAMEIGADLWHMNNASWRVTIKSPEFPSSFSTQRHETNSIFIDKKGDRFANERFELHTFGYALTNYDSQALCYPKIPCYWIFDEKRRSLGPLASYSGGCCNPPGGVMGDIYYLWSEDNLVEIERGWIMKASTLEDLGKQIKADPDDSGLLIVSNLTAAVKRYNKLCQKGEDTDFDKPNEWLQPIGDPPYYAAKLWLGGPNTQGGPKRNTRAQIVRVDGSPIPRLYSAGELGSVWSMLYQGSGNLGECIAFGRIAGANAATEKPWK